MKFELCYITDRKALEPDALLPRIEGAVRAGIDLIQIREKDLPTRELMEVVRAAEESARGMTSRIVVNDRLDVALVLGAAGVHLGTQSLPARLVRGMVPEDLLVGVSCHSLEEAQAAEADGADYLLLGPIYETRSKMQYGPPLGLDKLREVTGRVHIPVLALGGMNRDRVKPCLDCGAAGIAGISLFQSCLSMEECVRELRFQFAS